MKLSYASAVLFFLLTCHSAIANTINTQSYTPSISRHYLLVEDAMGDLHFRPKWFLGVEYNYLPNPLVVVDEQRSNRISTVVETIQTIDLQTAYFINPRFLIGLHLPIHSIKMNPDYGIHAFREYIGDLRPFVKFRLNPYDHPIGVGLLIDARLPTGKKDVFVSDESFAPSVRVLLERKFGRLNVAGHVGYLYAPNAVYQNLNEKNRLLYAIGGSLDLDRNEKVQLNAEFGGWTALNADALSPLDFLAGISWSLRQNLVLNAGAGIGKLSGPTGGEFRGLGGLKYYWTEDEHPVHKAAPAVVVTEKEIILNEEVIFETGQSKLSKDSYAVLDELADAIKSIPKHKMVEIQGHTNKLGTQSKNQKLSQDRAATVKNYLIEKGIAADRMAAKGYGSTQPVQKPGLTAKEHLILDKRVEIKIK